MIRTFLCAAVLLTSCGSDASMTQTATPKFSEIYPLIFPRMTKAQCTFCHGLPPNDKSNGMFSVGADVASAYAALVNKASVSSKCPGTVLVVAGKPDESLLLTKVTTPTCGDKMPLGGDPLTSDQIDMIRRWIAGGARND